MLEVHSTRDLPSAAKVTYWNDVVSDVFTPMETTPAKGVTFDAEVRCAQLGKLWLANAISEPAKVMRGARHIARSSDQRFFLHMQMGGRLKVAQDGKEAVLDRGDLVLCDSSLPYDLEYDHTCSTLVLIVPAGDLKAHLPAPEEVIGVKLSGERGLSSVTSVMLSSLWEQAGAGVEPELCSRVGDSLLDVFATSCTQIYGAKLEETAVSGMRRVQIKRYIEANLRDPDLTARSVAAAFGISPRYLHMLFSPEGESVSSYILRRRLEACVRHLTDALWRRRTITEIAFGWGFNNATHFSRVFRDRYGLSPREYRNRAA